ncbi:MAG: phosphatase PAP2 family protein [Desulfobacterota bacterium]|nr:phosphatase PAP2 family protein [Thermodesulfobacteriota bacterium]
MQALQQYRCIDYLTQGYIGLVGLVIAVFHGDRIAGWQFLCAAHGAVLVGVHGLIRSYSRHPHQWFVRFLRHFYPIILYTGMYRETGALNQIFVSGYLDPVFIRLEEKLFGCQPSLAFALLLPYRWAGELMYGAYFSYYVMIVGVGLALYFRQRDGFWHYLTVVSFVFYVCYFIYICLPVIGPRIFYSDVSGYHLPPDVRPAELVPLPEHVRNAVFYAVMGVIYDTFEASGAAFPSSHVAVALCTLYFSFQYLRQVRWVHAVFVFLLCCSTVYCRYHYAIDVIAGVATAGILLPVGNRLFAKWRGC